MIVTPTLMIVVPPSAVVASLSSDLILELSATWEFKSIETQAILAVGLQGCILGCTQPKMNPWSAELPCSLAYPTPVELWKNEGSARDLLLVCQLHGVWADSVSALDKQSGTSFSMQADSMWSAWMIKHL